MVLDTGAARRCPQENPARAARQAGPYASGSSSLLDGIGRTSAAVAIIDITGVALVDTHVASALIQSAKAAQLMGAQVVITGIRPEVAQILVALQLDLGGIVTRGNLQSGIAYARSVTDGAGRS